ncbi:MAG: peptidase MA family metallohydrolase [Chloroflexota bacterium]|nr:peptidase MA family metallohydrolase [Chloroflexota bacterium]
MPRIRPGRRVLGALALAILALVAAGHIAGARAASPEVEISPQVLREFPQIADDVVELYVEVPWTGEDPRETAILLELPERGWTHIEFVESVRYEDRIAALFELDLLGRLVTGIEFHYQWRFTDADGTNHLTPWRRVLTIDPSRPWRVESDRDIRVFWYDAESEFGARALADSLTAFDLVEESLGLDFQRQLKVVIYPTFDELYDALGIVNESRIKGVWRAGYELIMLQSDPEDETLAGVLTHEFAHAVLDQNLRNPWRDLPTWVHEGVATWIQAKADDDLPYERLLAAAHRDGRLRSLRGLQGYLPIDREGASLVYAQSYSMVKYLVNLYGIEDLRSMLQALSEGNTEDEALMAAYGIDAFTLENQWREFLEDDLAAAEDENRLAGAPVQTASPSDDPDPQLPLEDVAADAEITPADTLIGSPELPPADAGTRAFIAITGLTVIALFGLIGYLAYRRSSSRPALAVATTADPPPFALGLPAPAAGDLRRQAPSAKPHSLPASELARSGRARTGGFGFNRYQQLTRVRPDRFAGKRRPHLRRFRGGRS